MFWGGARTVEPPYCSSEALRGDASIGGDNGVDFPQNIISRRVSEMEAHSTANLTNYLPIYLRLFEGFDSLMGPLDTAFRAGNTAFFFRPTGCWQSDIS